MNAEKKLYTTKEAMRILGLTNKAGFFKKIKRHGIHPEKRSRFCFFTDEMIDDLKYNRSPGRPSRLKPEEKRPGKRKAAARKKKYPNYCWRVSVWNDELMKYVVVKCGMTKKQADEFAAGKDAVKRPCWR